MMPEKVAMMHRKLWLEVLESAARDYKSKKEERAFFFSDYFAVICDRANVDPGKWRERKGI
jgi:truncated hemoglobin YjbI